MKEGAKIITSPNTKPKRLPTAWKKAAGLLRGKKKVDALKYQRASRQSWEKRLGKIS